MANPFHYGKGSHSEPYENVYENMLPRQHHRSLAEITQADKLAPTWPMQIHYY